MRKKYMEEANIRDGQVKKGKGKKGSGKVPCWIAL